MFMCIKLICDDAGQLIAMLMQQRTILLVAVWLCGNGAAHINEVTLHRAGFVLRWVNFHVCISPATQAT